jgi:chemotaxis protein MotB
MIAENPGLSALAGQIRIDLTTEGLRIQILDEQSRPMFDTGAARLKDYTRDLLRELARMLNGTENRISISGHTDARPYAGGQRGYSNWELSADRANAARRELIAGGILENKIVRVVGLADSMHIAQDDPLDPSNRRISIVVMTKKAEQQVLGDSASPKKE